MLDILHILYPTNLLVSSNFFLFSQILLIPLSSPYLSFLLFLPPFFLYIPNSLHHKNLPILSFYFIILFFNYFLFLSFLYQHIFTHFFLFIFTNFQNKKKKMRKNMLKEKRKKKKIVKK